MNIVKFNIGFLETFTKKVENLFWNAFTTWKYKKNQIKQKLALTFTHEIFDCKIAKYRKKT